MCFFDEKFGLVVAGYIETHLGRLCKSAANRRNIPRRVKLYWHYELYRCVCVNRSYRSPLPVMELLATYWVRFSKTGVKHTRILDDFRCPVCDVEFWWDPSPLIDSSGFQDIADSVHYKLLKLAMIHHQPL